MWDVFLLILCSGPILGSLHETLILTVVCCTLLGLCERKKKLPPFPLSIFFPYSINYFFRCERKCTKAHVVLALTEKQQTQHKRANIIYIKETKCPRRKSIIVTTWDAEKNLETHQTMPKPVRFIRESLTFTTLIRYVDVTLKWTLTLR